MNTRIPIIVDKRRWIGPFHWIRLFHRIGPFSDRHQFPGTLQNYFWSEFQKLLELLNFGRPIEGALSIGQSIAFIEGGDSSESKEQTNCIIQSKEFPFCF